MIDEEFIGKRITELLRKANISESQMSLDLGYSRGYIRSLTSGKALPKMRPFFEICDYFSLTPLTFFDVEIQNPLLVEKTLEEIKKLSEEDLLMILNLVKRLQQSALPPAP